jgi:porphobilinogen deaminase
VFARPARKTQLRVAASNAMTFHCLQISVDLTTSLEAYCEIYIDSIVATEETRGLHWKVWVVSEDGRQATAVYLFADRMSAEQFLEGSTVAALRRIGALRDTSLLTGKELLRLYSMLSTSSDDHMEN